MTKWKEGGLGGRWSAWMLLLLGCVFGAVLPGVGAGAQTLAAAPPMGWNDWAHYECNISADTIVGNARALVRTGLAAHGYNTVTIDDCWMQKTRDAQGNLQPDLSRFPHGIKPVADAVHALGLKFGIYEDSGYETCGQYAGSGVPKGGGPDHFLQDAKLFESWGVDYLKLDGCNLYVPPGGTEESIYRKAYADQSAALKAVGRPIIFSESAPAYFQGTPDWYVVLAWVRGDGQLWREGTDIEVFNPRNPGRERFSSVLWNYAYNLPLGRFQKPGNWNDADFIIGGDSGMSAAESRSQLALWSMMSAPLILSSDLGKLSSQSVETLSNQAIIAVDQDPLGQEATLVRRSAAMDVLFKRLSGGDYAVAVLNRSGSPIRVDLRPAELGFAPTAACRLNARDLWSGNSSGALETEVASHDTAIWRVHADASCGAPGRTGTVTLTANTKEHDHGFEGYTRCLSASGSTEACAGTAAETWTVTRDGALQSGGRCLTAVNGKPAMQPCGNSKAQQWNYTLAGNLIDADHQCLTGSFDASGKGLRLDGCGHNRPDQIWSLPN